MKKVAKKDKRKNNGGHRAGAGRKPLPDPTGTRKNRGIQLTDPEYNYLVKKHGGFTAAIRSLLAPGWEFEE